LYEQSSQLHLCKYSIDADYSLKFDSKLAVLDAYIRNEKHEELQPVYYYYMEQVFAKTPVGIY
jgi:hypothetical protein